MLADGIPLAWLKGRGVALRGLRTPFGALDYRMRRSGEAITLDIGGSMREPPGGLILRSFDGGWRPGSTTINGKRARWKDGSLRINTLPARVVIH